jgi:hypothetical protein
MKGKQPRREVAGRGWLRTGARLLVVATVGASLTFLGKFYVVRRLVGTRARRVSLSVSLGQPALRKYSGDRVRPSRPHASVDPPPPECHTRHWAPPVGSFPESWQPAGQEVFGVCRSRISPDLIHS